MVVAAIASQAHNTASYDCWCLPRFYVICGACKGDGCAWCGKSDVRGMISITRWQAAMTDLPTLTVHNETVT
jgi:hypothetical protein